MRELVLGLWSSVFGPWSLVTCSMLNAQGSMFNAFLACGLVSLLYAFLIIFFTFGWYRKNKSAVGSRQSAVSIVISARNEEKNIADLLNDLLFQDYPKELVQIVVVDDHSEDRTFETVNDYIGKSSSYNILLLKTSVFDVSGKKAAINLGIEYATGEIIITTDADCRMGPGWLSGLVNYFDEEETTMVFGPVSYFEGKGFWDDFQSMEFAGLVASGAGAALAGHPFICNGANLAYRKDAFLKVSGFEGNERYISGDDVFLLHKMKKEFGRKSVVFCKDEKAIVNTYPAEGFRNFLRQRIRWASKSKGYNDSFSIFTALVVFSYSLTVLSSFIAGFFNPVYFFLFGGLLFWKMITDLPLILGITGLYHQKRLLKLYPVFQVIYPFYIVIAGCLSFFGNEEW